MKKYTWLVAILVGAIDGYFLGEIVAEINYDKKAKEVWKDEVEAH